MTEKKGKKEIDDSFDKAVVAAKEAIATATPAEKKEVITDKQQRLDTGSKRTNSRLKKAVESVERLGGSVSEVEPLKGPVVIIAGLRINPIATGLKPTGGSGELYVHEGKEFYLPHQLKYNSFTQNGVDELEPWVQTTNYQGPEMSLFAFVYDNETFYLLMDEHSSFTRDAETYYPRMKGGQLVLINSSSSNDLFTGHNVLANVVSENNTLSKSNIVVTAARVGRQRNWGVSSPFKLGAKRDKYSELRLKQVDVIDSELSRGRYFSSNFTKTSIAGNGQGENDISHTYLTECDIKGSKVTLANLTGEELTIRAEGEVLVKGVSSLSNQQWSFPSIHVTNRFAFTEIDHVNRHDRAIKMVRISPTEVEIAVALWKGGVKLAIAAPRQTVESVIRAELREDKDKKPEPTQMGFSAFGGFNGPFQPLGYRNDKPGETISNFMESYIVETVVSRLAMILMLDEVEECAEDLKRSRNTDYINFLE